MFQLASIFAGAFVPIASAYAAGRLVAPRTALPASVRFALGAAVTSFLIFLTLALDVGYIATWLALLTGLSLAAWRTPATPTPATPTPATKIEWIPLSILALTALVYLIYALAPETQPDAVGYHLRLVAEHVRTHSLGDRIGFYDVLPQPVEMLFTPAFAIGGHSAARLVHFAFLLVAALGVRDLGGYTAAAIFLLAPVAGIAGTSAYTDLALVCATTSGLLLLRRWNEAPVPVALAGCCAGFAYAIKPTFGLVGMVALVFIAGRARNFKAPALFIAGAVAVAAPWMWHAWWIAGNPVAPFLSRFFPNIVTTPDVTQRLVGLFNAFRPGFSWRTALYDYTLGGSNAGTLGPAFLLAPVLLFALRRRTGRWLLAATAVLLLPVLANTGTRFLLPAAAPAAVALVLLLPAPAALALVALQCAAAVIPHGQWHLGPVPVRAALRLQPEAEYLKLNLPGYPMVAATKRLPADARILAGTAVPEAYIDRETLIYWHNRQGMEFTDLLMFGLVSAQSPARLLSWRGTSGPVTVKATTEFRLVDASAPHRAWQRFGPGDAFTMPAAPNSDLLIWPDDQAQLRIEAGPEAERTRIAIDLRREITSYIKRAGYRYLAMPMKDSAFAPITTDMAMHPEDWGVTQLASGQSIALYRIR